ncbi:hypothetical protein SV7mr_47540 [Stieleria bergensis]|uniref:DUF1552 domain-containing protein n=1 Tax=Stieleria bergensis TaxID=2528025 RepID=A0A517T1E7_9BACT|nr:hypothetical protein SV7mr_47540 [Planctomycetes bacterium SV_7m_r]
MSQPLNRRRFALSSLAGSLALPALTSLGAEVASTAVKTVPVSATKGAGVGAPRFVAIANLLGFQTKQFFPETTGKAFDETTLLKPLAPNRDQLTVYRGLDHGIRGGHFAVHTFLSGVLHHESKLRPDGNVTVDQFMADAIGAQTRFPSIAVGSEGGIHGGCQLSWTRSGVRVPPITGPAELFEKLFVSDSQSQRVRQAQANKLQASILDSIQEEAGALSKSVNREDKEKLDEYFSSIRDVEKRLAARTQWHDQPKPDAPFDRPANRNTVDDLPLFYELIALALQTDSTRVATLEIGGSFLPQNLGINKSYHSMSHHGNNEDTIANLIKLETYQLEQYSKFLTRLADIRDGEQTLLDSTAVLFGSGMGNANSHTNTDLPIVVAGGGYATGQFKQTPKNGLGKVPLCNLLLGLAQRMGVPADQFGTSTGVYA